MLRIDVDGSDPYATPADNPFLETEGARPEVWAYGFRNPYRFSFDRGGTHELFLADVGQDRFEEVDVVASGGNYGWAIREGAHCFDPFHPSTPPASCRSEGLVPPIIEYDHGDGNSVIGGFVHRGNRSPALRGKYLFGDYSGRLFYLDTGGDRSLALEPAIVRGGPLGLVKGFGEDEDGEVYVLVSSNGGPSGTTGRVLRIAAAGPHRVPGDCTEDGKVDLADPLCLLGHLFGGGPARLPCGDGSAADPANVLLLNAQADGAVDIADAVSLLSWLFLGGRPPPDYLDRNGDGFVEPTCVPIGGCPQLDVCP